jgi:small subunit ribosomal protein S35
MGDTHPAEKKVVVQFSPNDLGLTKVQQEKLKKLAGPRYNPENELIRMSCESYAHPAQNKRYLSDLVDDLIAAAKDPKDTFEDVPLDLRHHKVESKPRFPKEWLMTEERRREIEAARRQNLLEDGKRAEAGLLLDGKQVIDDYLLRKTQEEEEKAKEPELVAAPTGKANRPATWASKSRR